MGYICIQSCEAGLAFKVYISYILYSAEYGIHFLYSLLSYNPPPSPLHLSTHRLPSSFLLPALSPLRLPTHRLPSSFLLPALSPLRLPTHRLPSSFLLPPVSLSYSSVHPSFLLLPPPSYFTTTFLPISFFPAPSDQGCILVLRLVFLITPPFRNIFLKPQLQKRSFLSYPCSTNYFLINYL